MGWYHPTERGVAEWAGTIPLKEESQRTYLLTCVRNRCLNIIAHRQTQQEAIRLLKPEAIASEMYDDEIVEMVNRYVDEKLSPQTSRIIKMHFDEDQSLQFAGHQPVGSQQAHRAGVEETTFNF